MPVKSKRMTLDELQAAVKACEARLDAVHDRAASTERAAVTLKEAVLSLLAIPLVGGVHPSVLAKAKRAIQFATEVGV